jgi:hypothetical protein
VFSIFNHGVFLSGKAGCGRHKPRHKDKLNYLANKVVQEALEVDVKIDFYFLLIDLQV